jgi:hypothetical protein
MHADEGQCRGGCVVTTLLTAWDHGWGNCVSMAVAFVSQGPAISITHSLPSAFLAATCNWTLGEKLMATTPRVYSKPMRMERIRIAVQCLEHVSQPGTLEAPTVGVWVLQATANRQLWLPCLRNLLLLGCGYSLH